MKNKTKYLIVTLCMLVGFLLAGAAIANAETTDITEINLTGNYQYGTVPAGILPPFNPATTTDSITIDRTNSSWEYKMQNGAWSGFGLETPVAYNDGKTDYGYSFAVNTKKGYQLASGFKVFYKAEDVTSSVKVLKYAWGAYVTVDLGKANGTPVVYTITFNSNDGTLVESQNVNAGEKVSEPTPAPTKEGFTFDGWYEDSTFSKKFDFNTPITDSMTLYAKWTENKYTLTFDANGGTGTMSAIPDLTGEYTLPSNGFTAPSGKQFKGWSLTTDGETVTKVDMTENKTVYAIWEDIPVVTYTLTFDANGGTGSMTAKPGLTGEYILPANGFTAPSGKQFKGWSLTTNGAIVTKVDMTENKKVYAIWEDIPVVTYTLTFDANGGTGSMTAKTGLTGEYTLPSNEFTAPSGKQFKGWSLTTNGAIVTKVDMTENRTVYAIWTNIGGGGGSSSGGGGGFYVPTTQKPEIKATAGGKAELSKDGTTLTITADAGKVIDKVLLNGKDMGAASELKGLKTGDKVEVTFKDQVTEPTKEQLDKAAKEAAGELVLTARSAKLKNGSVKVMLKGDLKAITDTRYTVKYKFYRSTKKSAGYKAVLTKKAPTYFNTYGKKGTMYYYKAKVMIYDKDGNSVAQTALKQCKYANRLWTK